MPLKAPERIDLLAHESVDPPPAESLPLLTLDEARQVIWQGRKGMARAPMGGMLESGQLTVADLQWAATAHFNARVKAAAQRLLTVAEATPQPANRPGAESRPPAVPPAVLQVPTSFSPLPPPPAHADPTSVLPLTPVLRAPVSPSLAATPLAPGITASLPALRYGPTVICGSNYLEDQVWNGSAYLFFYLGMLLAGVVWLVPILLLRDLAADVRLQFLAFGFVWAVGLATLMSRHLRRVRTFTQGRRGEDATVEVLRTALDARWTLFRNLQLPGRKDDLDVVLVGPGGVWVLEIKAYRVQLRVQAGRWEQSWRGGWRPFGGNPGGQAQRNAVRLREFLQQQGLDLRWVSAVVVLARPQQVAHFVAADPPVWLLPTLTQDVTRLERWGTMPPAVSDNIIAVLRREADRQLAREEVL